MNLSYAIHTLGVVFWIGGLLFACKLIKVATEDAPVLRVLSKKVAFGFIVPGFIITLLTGLHQLFAGGMGTYMKQGWMHAKLTLVALLFWSTAALFMSLLAMSRGEKVSSSASKLHHAIVSASLLAGLILVFVKPF
jgi:putative membrane protein